MTASTNCTIPRIPTEVVDIAARDRACWAGTKRRDDLRLPSGRNRVLLASSLTRQLHHDVETDDLDAQRETLQRLAGFMLGTCPGPARLPRARELQDALTVTSRGLVLREDLRDRERCTRLCELVLRAVSCTTTRQARDLHVQALAWTLVWYQRLTTTVPCA